MEVDLLCADARVAIELDGAQHLADPEAYRRDRRKDQLLQENGYFVLRFLAEDVGKELDMVLDTIKRALFSRRDCNTSVVIPPMLASESLRPPTASSGGRDRTPRPRSLRMPGCKLRSQRRR